MFFFYFTNIFAFKVQTDETFSPVTCAINIAKISQVCCKWKNALLKM